MQDLLRLDLPAPKDTFRRLVPGQCALFHRIDVRRSRARCRYRNTTGAGIATPDASYPRGGYTRPAAFRLESYSPGRRSSDVTRRDVSHIGRYEIQRRLGAGGMGALYLARDPGLDRLVAIKLLKDDFQDDPGLRERFVREARSVARLRHPNIVVVHDVGEDDGRPFMAMEYIAGETLDQVLRRTPSLPLARRLELVEELCAGLAHAHGRASSIATSSPRTSCSTVKAS